MTVFYYRAKICLLDFRSIATREGVPWVNDFHPLPPWTKPSILNAERKIQNKGNARARVFKVRLICPAVVTKCEGPRSSRLQPAQLRAAPLRAIRARAREAKTFNKKKGRAGGPNFEPEHPLASFDILHGNNIGQNS